MFATLIKTVPATIIIIIVWQACPAVGIAIPTSVLRASQYCTTTIIEILQDYLGLQVFAIFWKLCQCLLVWRQERHPACKTRKPS